jgi:hypothetical protein
VTPFQSLMATIYMLLAKARQPADERKLVVGPSRADMQRTRRELSKPGHPRTTPMRRRRTDWPSEHAPFFQRMWQAVRAWGTRGHAGTKG